MKRRSGRERDGKRVRRGVAKYSGVSRDPAVSPGVFGEPAAKELRRNGMTGSQACDLEK